MSAGNPSQSEIVPVTPTAALPPAIASAPTITSTPSPSTAPPRQLSELPLDELATLAEEFGLDSTRFKKDRQALVSAVHERRQLIALIDRDAMLDVIRWGRRPVTMNASKEQIAMEIARIKSMKFAGLSNRGLLALARLRGLQLDGDEPVPVIIKRLKRQEGFVQKINRKRRSFIGSLVSNMIGEAESPREYQFLPPPATGGTGAHQHAPPTPAAGSIKDDIEESGLIGGLANRVKKTADSYLNQKLDEIESRIDRKLDEIDRRLAEWRDKEIANRIRILKITLWASVVVGAFSLIYSYAKVYLMSH